MLIPARRLGRFAPSGSRFALAFSVALLPQALCFTFAFLVASLPRALYFILASTLALCARLPFANVTFFQFVICSNYSYSTHYYPTPNHTVIHIKIFLSLYHSLSLTQSSLRRRCLRRQHHCINSPQYPHNSICQQAQSPF